MSLQGNVYCLEEVHVLLSHVHAHIAHKSIMYYWVIVEGGGGKRGASKQQQQHGTPSSIRELLLFQDARRLRLRLLLDLARCKLGGACHGQGHQIDETGKL